MDGPIELESARSGRRSSRRDDRRRRLVGVVDPRDVDEGHDQRLLAALGVVRHAIQVATDADGRDALRVEHGDVGRIGGQSVGRIAEQLLQHAPEHGHQRQTRGRRRRHTVSSAVRRRRRRRRGDFRRSAHGCGGGCDSSRRRAAGRRCRCGHNGADGVARRVRHINGQRCERLGILHLGAGLGRLLSLVLPGIVRIDDARLLLQLLLLLQCHRYNGLHARRRMHACVQTRVSSFPRVVLALGNGCSQRGAATRGRHERVCR